MSLFTKPVTLLFFSKCSYFLEFHLYFQALVPEKVKKAYREKIKTLQDPLMVLDLYFCGTLEHPERIKEILKNGFTEERKKTQLSICKGRQFFGYLILLDCVRQGYLP